MATAGPVLIHALTPKTTPHDPLIDLQPQLLIAQGVIVFCLGCDALKVVGEPTNPDDMTGEENETVVPLAARNCGAPEPTKITTIVGHNHLAVFAGTDQYAVV